jgi:hypothetical protein
MSMHSQGQIHQRCCTAFRSRHAGRANVSPRTVSGSSRAGSPPAASAVTAAGSWLGWPCYRGPSLAGGEPSVTGGEARVRQSRPGGDAGPLPDGSASGRRSTVSLAPSWQTIRPGDLLQREVTTGERPVSLSARALCVMGPGFPWPLSYGGPPGRRHDRAGDGACSGTGSRPWGTMLGSWQCSCH